VLPNDAGDSISVVDFEQVDPVKGHLELNPDGSFTFTPVQGFHGTVSVGYTIEDEYGQQAHSTLTIVVGPDLPLIVNVSPHSKCLSDVPYLEWDLSLPAGFPDQGTSPLSITFINPNGDDYTISGLPLKGSMLWPGASDGNPKQWPGWKLLADGTYVETDGNFAWTRDGVEVLFKVNPETTITVNYPKATAACANPPAEPADNEDPTGSLSFTGSDAIGFVPIAGAFILLGFFLVFLARRRRDDEEEAAA
jgi:LPXTG-motif cell wall-anchored protein